MKKRECTFSIKSLARFLTTKFFEITNVNNESDENMLIRNEESIRQDLYRWGVKFGSNSTQPYFEGHERLDVINERTKFVDYFLSRSDHYYRIEDEGDQPKWISPTEKPCVLMFHDESLFRTGENNSKRWFLKGHEPFYNKGKYKCVLFFY